MLELEDVQTFYGPSQALFGVSMKIGVGEIVTLMGRNGMGKTTTVRSILGLTPPARGQIRFCGRSIVDLPSFQIARLGIGLVPEGRQIFASLTVRENLVATAANHAAALDPWTLERVMALFPRLAERADSMGRTLSGGEQQMLAIGRALMTNPTLLVLDEATEGLAPLVRAEIWSILEHALKPAGHSILIIDKHAEALARLADRHYVIEKGRIVWSGPSRALRADDTLRTRFLGV